MVSSQVAVSPKRNIGLHEVLQFNSENPCAPVLPSYGPTFIFILSNVTQKRVDFNVGISQFHQQFSWSQGSTRALAL